MRKNYVHDSTRDVHKDFFSEKGTIPHVLLMFAIIVGTLLAMTIFLPLTATILIIIETFSSKESVDNKKRRVKKAKIGSLSIFIVGLLNNPQDREYIIGCYKERFAKDSKKYGKWHARGLFWRDVIDSIPPGIWEKLIKFLKWLIFGSVAKYIISFWR